MNYDGRDLWVLKSELNWAMRFIRSGKTLSDKIKISLLFAFSLFRNRSSMRLGDYFDLLVKGMILETDIKFNW